MSKLQNVKLHLTNELKPAKLNTFLLDKVAVFPPVYSLIYLHLNALARKESIVNIEHVRKKFNTTYADVLGAITCFEKAELLYFKEKDENFYISFSSAFTEPVSEIVIENKEVSKRYTAVEIEEMTSNSPELKVFYSDAQKVFNYSFSYSDYERLLYIHEEYLLPLEVILTVINYCKLESKLNMNYLEQVCRTLYSEGVTDVETAKKYLNISGDSYTEILKALSIKGTLKPIQKDVIDKWFKEYNYTIDIILEACDKAVLSTNNPNLNYVNGILKNWYMANIKNMSDIYEYEKSFTKSYGKNQNQKPKAKNTINNFDSEPTDYSDIERLERKFLNL